MHRLSAARVSIPKCSDKNMIFFSARANSKTVIIFEIERQLKNGYKENYIIVR